MTTETDQVTGVMTVLDPVAPVVDRSQLPLASRGRLGPGAKIGFISNGKPNATRLLKQIENLLVGGFRLTSGPWFDKNDAGGAGAPSPPDWLDSMLRSGAIAVIAASGD